MRLKGSQRITHPDGAYRISEAIFDMEAMYVEHEHDVGDDDVYANAVVIVMCIL